MKNQIKLLLQSARITGRMLRGTDVDQTVNRVSKKTSGIFYFLDWQTLLGFSFYRLISRNKSQREHLSQFRVVWAPFYPVLRVDAKTRRISIGKSNSFATRAVCFIAKFLSKDVKAIVTSSREFGLPRPRNLEVLGFSKSRLRFVKHPSQGIDFLRCGLSPVRAAPLGLFFVWNYRGSGDSRLGFIARQADRHECAVVVVIGDEERRAAVEQAIKSRCEKVEVILVENCGNLLRKAPQKSSSKPFFGRQINLLRFAKQIYFDISSRLPDRIVRFVPGPTSALPEQMARFQSNLLALAGQTNFEWVHSHDLISAPAGGALAKSVSARHVIDVAEFPVLSLRAGRMFRRMNLGTAAYLEKQIKAAMSAAEHMISVSNGVSRVTRRHLGYSATPIHNYRNRANFEAEFEEEDIRRDWGIPSNAILLVHCCTYAPQYRSEILVSVLENLPDKFHLVMVGSASPEEYADSFQDLAKKAGVIERIHFKEEIDDERDYIHYLAGGDIGLIVLKPTTPLVRFGLANRAADLMAAGLPIVTTPSIELSSIINKNANGVVVESMSGEKIAMEILSLSEDRDRLERMKLSAVAVSKKLNWQEELSRYPVLKRGLDHTQPSERRPLAAIVFMRGIDRNRRAIRIGNALHEKGYRVAFFVAMLPSEETQKLHPHLTFLRVPARTEIHPGLLQNQRRKLKELAQGN